MAILKFLGGAFSGVFGFLFKHWKITLPILAIIGVGFYIWVLRSHISSLKHDKANLTTQNVQLIKTLKQQTASINTLHKKEEATKKQLDIVLNKENKKVDQKTSKEVKIIYKTKVSPQCQEAMQWFKKELMTLSKKGKNHA